MDQIWNPHSPDNMMVRHRALERGRAFPSTFEGEQGVVRSLSRKRRRLEARGELTPPTTEELRTFLAECRDAGFEGVPRDPE